MSAGKGWFVFPFLVWLLLGLTSCGQPTAYERHAKGFHVPEGDPVVGESLFKELQCYKCHSVKGVDLSDDGPGILENKVLLGGERYQITSYGELVTSIIDPNHSISLRYLANLSEEEKKGPIESPMIVYNRDITVQELIDLAAFLHTKYVYKPRPYSYYYYQ